MTKSDMGSPPCNARAFSTLTWAVTPSIRFGSSEQPIASSRRIAVSVKEVLLSAVEVLQQLHSSGPLSHEVTPELEAVGWAGALCESRQHESVAPVVQQSEHPKPPSHNVRAMRARALTFL